MATTRIPQHDQAATSPEITKDLIARFLTARGWINQRPGFLFAWKHPTSGLNNYTLTAALENQLIRDQDIQSANAEKFQAASTVVESANNKSESVQK